ncbi:MAG: hypothetical protein V1897_09540, partial [Pseudomonadota bacterium]
MDDSLQRMQSGTTLYELDSAKEAKLEKEIAAFENQYVVDITLGDGGQVRTPVEVQRDLMAQADQLTSYSNSSHSYTHKISGFALRKLPDKPEGVQYVHSYFPNVESAEPILHKVTLFDFINSVAEETVLQEQGWTIKHVAVWKGFYPRELVYYYAFATAVYDEPVDTSQGRFYSAGAYFSHMNNDQIVNALTILKKHFSEIDPANMTLAYHALNSLELTYLNSLDVKQDLAASHYAGAPEYEALRNEFAGWASPINWFFSTEVGQKAWELSSQIFLDSGSQGYGPLQIIPDLANAAFLQGRADGWYGDYASILSPDDFTDGRAIMRACFNKEKMYALKALTWELQLREMRKIDDLRFPYSIFPFIKNAGTARQLALLQSARELIQNPDDPSLALEDVGFSSPANIVTDMYQMGDLLGLQP